MDDSTAIIKKAEFSPNIKTYILLVVAFFMFVSIAGIPIMIIWFLGPGQYVSRRFYENIFCTLTDRHLEFKRGVLFKKEKTIPLENIQDLTFIQNPLLNWLDLKILKIETAGQSNPQGMSDMRLVGIVQAESFKKMVLEQRSKIVQEYRSGGQKTESNETVELLKEIRDLFKHYIEKKPI